LQRISNRIDAHHHLWRYTPEEYGWINDQMQVLRRDFLPGELKPLLDRAGVYGSIAVQARQTLEETRWLLEQAEQAPWIEGVIGWAPIASPEFPDVLRELCRNEKLKGLRHIIQDEADDEFILHPAFNRGIRALRETGLVYEILIHARHVPQAIRFVDQHPEQVFVLDHCAKPPIASREVEPWALRIRELAKQPNISCKLSGLVTEADWRRWTPSDLQPYWEVVLESFGPERLLFGSDWPVLLLATEYHRWIEIVAAWLDPLSQAEQDAIWGGTARRIYSL
jgi:L-fucono-1,5-lactonase